MSFFGHKYTNPEEVANLPVEKLEAINPLQRKQIKTQTIFDAIVELRVQKKRILKGRKEENLTNMGEILEINKINKKISILQAKIDLKTAHKSLTGTTSVTPEYESKAVSKKLGKMEALSSPLDGNVEKFVLTGARDVDRGEVDRFMQQQQQMQDEEKFKKPERKYEYKELDEEEKAELAELDSGGGRSKKRRHKDKYSHRKRKLIKKLKSNKRKTNKPKSNKRKSNRRRKSILIRQ